MVCDGWNQCHSPIWANHLKIQYHWSISDILASIFNKIHERNICQTVFIYSYVYVLTKTRWSCILKSKLCNSFTCCWLSSYQLFLVFVVSQTPFDNMEKFQGNLWQTNNPTSTLLTWLMRVSPVSSLLDCYERWYRYTGKWLQSADYIWTLLVYCSSGCM